MASRCRSCAAAVIWCVNTETRRAAPIDPKPVPDGNVVMARDTDGEYVYRVLTDAEMSNGIARGKRHKSHFATCPNAADHRRPTSHTAEQADVINRTGA